MLVRTNDRQKLDAHTQDCENYSEEIFFKIEHIFKNPEIYKLLLSSNEDFQDESDVNVEQNLYSDQ